MFCLLHVCAVSIDLVALTRRRHECVDCFLKKYNSACLYKTKEQVFTVETRNTKSDCISLNFNESFHRFCVKYNNYCVSVQYTCQNNLPSTTELLITKGNANYQMRHAPTGKVPLHDAAQRGHIECIKVWKGPIQI